jgi:predicted TIM-barrel fold metal-dependent hydrolase
VERAQAMMAALSPEARGKILGENARKLYRL